MRKAILPVALLAALSAGAQLKETVNVTVVEVPVTVVDRDGNPVRGLTAANFELLDGGVKRSLSSFDTIDFAATESMKKVSPLNPAARRNFMLLFDLSFSSPTALTKAQQAARDFITNMVQTRDLVAIGTVDVDHGFRLLTAFTTDRNLLLAAIRDPQSFQGNDPLQIAGSPIYDAPESPTSDVNKAGRTDRAQAEESLRDVTRQAGRLDNAYNRQRVDKQLTMLGGLANVLRSVAGRKQIILLSEGFDPKLIEGRTAKPTAEMQRENDASFSGQIWNIDTDARFGNSGSMTNLSKMAEYFRRSDVVLHAIDIQGLRVQNDLKSGARESSNEGLFMVAMPTGGVVFQNTNDLASDFQRMLRRQEVVYVLGFTAPSGAPGKFHDLKVKLVNVPGGARAFHRLGYYEMGGESGLERSLSTAEVIVNDIPQEDIHIATLAAPFPTAAAKSQVPVIIEISGADLLKSASGKLITAEVFVYAFDEQGIVRDSLFQRMGLDLDKLGEKLRTSGLKYYGTLALDEGKYAVRSLVRVAESNQKGYARVDLVVPHAGDLAVSQPLFYEEAGKWLMVKGSSHDATNAGYPFEINGETFIPSAAGTGGRFAVFVYGASPEEIAFETKPQAKLVTEMKSAKGTKLVFDLDKPQSVDVVVRKK